MQVGPEQHTHLHTHTTVNSLAELQNMVTKLHTRKGSTSQGQWIHYHLNLAVASQFKSHTNTQSHLHEGIQVENQLQCPHFTKMPPLCKEKYFFFGSQTHTHPKTNNNKLLHMCILSTHWKLFFFGTGRLTDVFKASAPSRPALTASPPTITSQLPLWSDKQTHPYPSTALIRLQEHRGTTETHIKQHQQIV